MRRLRRWIDRSLDHPRITIALFCAVTIAFGLFLPGLELATDGRSLLPPAHPLLKFQAEVDATFSSADFVIVGVAAKDSASLFTPASLAVVERLSRAVEDLPGIDSQDLRSLSTVASPRWLSLGLELQPPLDREVRTPGDAAEVREIALGDPLLRRVLVSADGSAAALYAPVAQGTDRRALMHRIEELLAAERERPGAGKAGLTLHLLGPTTAESLLGDHVLADLARLLPLAMAAMALLLWVWFRHPAILVVGVGESVMVITWSLGLMGALGKGLSLVTVVMPVILATYCVADTIHVAQRLRDKCVGGSREARRAALGETLDEILKPVLFTSLTTGAGFLAFAFSPLPPVRDFGLFCAFGIFSAIGTSLFAVPCGLLLCRFGRAEGELAVPALLDRLLQRAMLGASLRPVATLAAMVGVSLVLGAGALRIEIQDSWIDNFKTSSPLVRSDRWFNANFSGSNILNVVVEASPGGACEAGFLGALSTLQARLAGHSAVGGTLSLTDQLGAVGRTLEGKARLPRDRREAEQWMLLVRMAGGDKSLSPYVDPTCSVANLWVFLNRADYRKTSAAVATAEAFTGWPGAQPPRVRFAGDAWLGRLLVDLISRSQGVSLLAAIVFNLLVVWVMLRSWGDSILVILPVTLAVLWNFGLMGWLGMPLGVATSTFSAIALGIGIDFALHWQAKLRLELAAGKSWEEALRGTASSTGGAILLNGIVLICGFGILLLSAVPPNRQLALLLAVNLLACLLMSLLLLPAVGTLLVHAQARREERRAAAPAPMISREAGYNLVVLMVVLTLLNVAVAASLPLWSMVIRREKEEELIFRGLQYAEAIRVFNTRYGRPPVRLEELVEVRPRCIRRLWQDPLTEEGKWVILRELRRPNPEDARQGHGVVVGGIIGVRSSSQRESVKVMFGSSRYTEWHFTKELFQPGKIDSGDPALSGPLVRAVWIGRPLPFQQPPLTGQPDADRPSEETAK
jgi:uncharacterized protein